MSPQIIIALIIALAGFGSAWKIQDWRYGAKENDRAEQNLVDVRQSAAAAIHRIDNVSTAQSAAAARLNALRVDADGSRSALISLSLAADSALRDAATSQTACLATATSLGDVLKTVSAERRELSEKADLHVSDIKTLMDAWPK